MGTPDLPRGPQGKTSKTRAIPIVSRFSHLQLPRARLCRRAGATRRSCTTSFHRRCWGENTADSPS
ncbi:hypothetical protein H8959_001809 [Pygathrix nigripes]